MERMQPLLGFDVGGVRRRRVGETAKIKPLSARIYLRLPSTFPYVIGDARIAGRIVGQARSVLQILRLGGLAKINDTVVAPHTIDVVKLMRRPQPVDDPPS